MTNPARAERAPALERRGFICSHCDVFAQQTWETITYRVEDNQGEIWPEDLEPYEGPPRGPGVPPRWRGARCGACDRWSLWRDGAMVYPAVGRVGGVAHEDMPQQVRELYEEAAAVASVSARAGAAFARVVVERLLRYLEPEAPLTLELLIAQVKRRGISLSLGDMLDVVRVTGNEAVHVSDNPNDLMVLVLDTEEGPELVELLLQTANDLVEELITKPRRASELSAKIPPGIRARIEHLAATIEPSGATVD